MSKSEWNCPIVICAFNRPEFFSKCLEHISKTINLKENEIPVYVFCDGGPNSKQKEISEIISNYPIVTETFNQNTHLHVAKHIHFIRETIFDKMKYDRIMFIEEDILTSPYYYDFINRAFDWFEKHDQTVGVVNSSIICHETLDKKISNRMHFVDGLHSLTNYIMSKNTWNLIRPIMQEYVDKFDYNKLDIPGIISWAKDKLLKSNAEKAKRFCNSSFFNTFVSSQDSISNIAMRVNNICYISSGVNRVLNIGNVGVHINPVIFEKLYGGINLDIIEEDKDEFNSDIIILPSAL